MHTFSVVSFLVMYVKKVFSLIQKVGLKQEFEDWFRPHLVRVCLRLHIKHHVACGGCGLKEQTCFLISL